MPSPETGWRGPGRIDNSNIVAQGGVIQQAMLFPVHAAEIVRATSLAIRRRRELMGPIGRYDPLTNNLLNVLSRNPGPPNHWSQAWVQVQLGCAYAASGDAAQAKSALERGVLVAGEFDHPLTSTALLELGRLALETGDFPAAGRLFQEASYAAFTFLDLNNLEESFRYGLLAHVLLNQKGPYPPLGRAAAWAKAQGFRQLQTSLALLSAENMAVVGETAQASNLLSTASSLAARSDLPASRLGARMNHLKALVAYQSGNVPAGDRSLQAALQFQQNGSIWMFQIGLADTRYTSGQASDRVGTALYRVLLRDPTAGDWAYDPLECLSVLTTPHGEVLEHWFEATLENKREQELALEISDRARRHRFFSTLPLGGRLLALRWILEGPPELVGQQGLLQRQDLLARHPQYAALAQRAADVRARLAALPAVCDDEKQRTEQAGQLAILADLGQQQEAILRQIAVRREASDLVFPPLRTTAEVQQSLPEGHVLMAFFSTRKDLYGFMYSRDQYATWRVRSPSQLQKQVAALLRAMGNFDVNHELTQNDLANDGWRASAKRVTDALLAGSNVELAGNFQELAIVPDGFLWYLPFEALGVGDAESRRMLISQARVRYAPTVGLAVPVSRVQKPQPKIGVVLGKLFPGDGDAIAADAFEHFDQSVGGAVALPNSLPVPSNVFRMVLDGLIVLDDIGPAKGPYEWSPVQVDAGKAGGNLASWLSLPWGGPDHVVLPGFHTAAETSFRRGSAAGDDLFLATCGLMAAGTRTILISRWRTGGQTSYDLVREFAQELPYTSPADAWQRSVQIAADTQLEPVFEPRVRDNVSSGAVRKADQPFFWAGYLLVDSGVPPAGQDKALAVPGLKPPADDDPSADADLPPDDNRPAPAGDL